MFPFENLYSEIEAFCRAWKVTEFAVFGSATRDDFTSSSDIDVLVTFAAEAKYSLMDLVRAQYELEAIFDRRVDLVERQGVETSDNHFRRDAILGSAKVLYAA